MNDEKLKQALESFLKELGGFRDNDVFLFLNSEACFTFEGDEIIEIARHFYKLGLQNNS